MNNVHVQCVGAVYTVERFYKHHWDRSKCPDYRDVLIFSDRDSYTKDSRKCPGYRGVLI